MTASRPTYDLAGIKALAAAGEIDITMSAVQGARNLHLDASDILECVASLEDRDFYKSMPADLRPGLFQDVYKRQFLGFPLYVKLQISARRRAVVISFKQDESV